jgi:hypothetical protein
MPSPINELSAQAPIEASPATPTEVLSPKQALESDQLLVALERSEKLGFLEQARIVRQGFSKGVKYDGCTGVPDFDFGADCCGEHDYHYQQSDINRAEADRRLRKCIQQKGYIVLPWVFWLGVRLFGGRYYRKKQNEIFPLADDEPLT